MKHMSFRRQIVVYLVSIIVYVAAADNVVQVGSSKIRGSGSSRNDDYQSIINDIVDEDYTTNTMETSNDDDIHVDAGDYHNFTAINSHPYIINRSRRHLQFYSDGLSHNVRHEIMIAGRSEFGDRSIMSAVSSSSTTNDNGMAGGRSNFWINAWPKFDSSKTTKAVWDTALTLGRPTLAKHHVIVVPTAWDGETVDGSVFKYNEIDSVMKQLVQCYKNMSWSKNSVTYEIYNDPVTLTGIRRDFGGSLDPPQKFLRQYMNETKKLKEFVDFSGLLLLHTPSTTGNLAGGGGWGSINGNFMWMAYTAGFAVLRHELGHNYGHPHHIRNDYEWRITEGETEHFYDGFDMMSGGNGYALSDLPAASKWFFNWITDDNVIHMQPEGPTKECPKCVSSIEGIVLNPFDNPKVPPSSTTKMLISIPITAVQGSWYTRAYSYYLSYRGFSVNGLASGGLSVHLGWFDLGGLYGASYDSLNYDAFGDTKSGSDSFVVPGTCYHITPPGEVMNVDAESVEEIQPIVCVDKVDPTGKSITVSVSFKDPSEKLFTPTQYHNCSKDGTSSGEIALDFTPGNVHLAQFDKAGFGTIELSMCKKTSATTNVKAFFYDTIPYVLPSTKTPPGYTSFLSLNVTKPCSTGFDTISYKTQQGAAYVYMMRDESTSPTSAPSGITYKTKCTVATCTRNQYMASNGVCRNCPSGSISPEGSTSEAKCVSCSVDGLIVPHRLSSSCSFTDDTSKANTTGREWRLLAPKSSIVNGWAWDIDNIRFYSSADCKESSLVNTEKGTAFSSGIAGAGWEPINAFGDKWWKWGGRSDSRGMFYIGMTFPSTVTVKCVNFTQESSTTDVWIQSRVDSTSNYNNVGVAHGLKVGTVIVKLETSTTPIASPVAKPVATTPVSTPVSKPSVPTPVVSKPTVPVAIPTVPTAPIKIPAACTKRCNRKDPNTGLIVKGYVIHKILTSTGSCKKLCVGAAKLKTQLARGYKCGSCPAVP